MTCGRGLLPRALDESIGDRAVGGQGSRIEIDVGGQRVRCEPRNHHLGFGVDVDRLPMNAPRHVYAMVIVRDPPEVVVAPTWERCIVAREEGFAVATAAYFVHDGSGNDLFPILLASKAHELAETREIAQACIQRATG